MGILVVVVVMVVVVVLATVKEMVQVQVAAAAAAKSQWKQARNMDGGGAPADSLVGQFLAASRAGRGSRACAQSGCAQAQHRDDHDDDRVHENHPRITTKNITRKNFTVPQRRMLRVARAAAGGLPAAVVFELAAGEFPAGGRPAARAQDAVVVEPSHRKNTRDGKSNCVSRARQQAAFRLPLFSNWRQQ